MVEVFFAQATYDQDWELTKRCVERVAPYVDAVIIVEDGSLTELDRQWLKEYAEKHNMEFQHKKEE